MRPARRGDVSGGVLPAPTPLETRLEGPRLERGDDLPGHETYNSSPLSLEALVERPLWVGPTRPLVVAGAIVVATAVPSGRGGLLCRPSDPKRVTPR